MILNCWFSQLAFNQLQEEVVWISFPFNLEGDPTEAEDLLSALLSLSSTTHPEPSQFSV